jgi:hypothetical protein
LSEVERNTNASIDGEAGLHSITSLIRFSRQEDGCMNSESSVPRHDTEFCYDSENRLREVRQVAKDDGSVIVSCRWDPDPLAPSFTIEHGKQKRLFVLTSSDGKIEHCRDNPVLHLMAGSDPQTGEMQPVIRFGKTAFIYLSREDRER